MFSPPYVKCPYCGKDTFGIALIAGNRYFRRCCSCFRPSGHEHPPACILPKLDKRIIYLDQMVISNILKAIHPDVPPEQRNKLDPFWLELYERLDVLCRLQQTVCASSDFHRTESQVTPYFDSLRRLYTHLSCGVSFYDHKTIQNIQLQKHFRCYLTGVPFDRLDLSVDAVTHGELNSWTPRMRISVNIEYDPRWAEEHALAREKVHQGMGNIFARWRNEANRDFDSWYFEEARSLGPLIAEVYSGKLQSIFRASLAGSAPSIEILLGDAVTTVHSLVAVGEMNGLSAAQAHTHVVEYLHSDALLEIPFNNISSLIYAAIARKAAAGQQSPPNAGMATDVDFISCFLPYCDAMFVDNACRAYLTEEPVASRLGFNTRIYSMRTKESLLEWLDVLRRDTPLSVIAGAQEIYGDDCVVPYIDLFGAH